MRILGWLMLALALPALACSTPVSVQRVSAQRVHRSLTANVLSTSRPSADSVRFLHALNLFDLYDDDPDAALRAMRTAMLPEADRTDLLFALAELEFHRGLRVRRADSRPHFLAAAVYSWAYMASVSPDDPLFSIDPRLRVAADLYNRGLTSGLADEEGEYVDLSPRTLTLPFGELVLKTDEEELLWSGFRMNRFVPVAELEVRGLRTRYRRPGIGAPLAASIDPVELESPPPGAGHISSMVRVAATALVVFEHGAESIEANSIAGRLRLYTLDDATEVTLGKRKVALEYEPTAALAFGVAESRFWEFEQRGFLSGDFGQEFDLGVRMLAPYDPDRIPVVFVHGTASSPWRWAEMINHFQSRSKLLERYQFWLFQYNTGSPMPYSAGLLREALSDLVAELDPEGDDAALKQMVVVGHSQGGLLAKLCVVKSGDVFWDGISSAPIDELELRPETRQLLERSLFFTPLPFVRRVVFVATPHRGSFLAERWFVRFAARMVSFSGDVIDAAGDLAVQDDDRILVRGLEDMPSSIDNMTRDNPFLLALAEMPVAPGVEAHSIIAVSVESDDPAVAHDGVVTVESQRIEGVKPEFIVRSGHSTQRHPITIGEVARILRDALEDAPHARGDAD